MRESKDINGQKFGELYVLEKSNHNTRHTYWKCVCSCGNIKIVRGSHLWAGNVKSCGSCKKEKIIGKKVGNLLIIERDTNSKASYPKYKCKCDCGNFKSVAKTKLLNNKISHCGCFIGTDKDLAGKRFGKLTVIKKTDSTGRGAIWECKCSCNNIRLVNNYQLVNNKITSCKDCIKDKTSLVGKSFGFLTVLRFDESKPSGSSWLCSCSCKANNCKKEISVTKSSLFNKTDKIKSCYYGKNNINSSHWMGYEEISMTKWSSIKNGAKNRELDFNLSIEELWKLYLQQNKKCALTGVDISFKHDSGYQASVDRIDSNLGYNITNVWLIHKDLNFMKAELSVDEFLYWCNLVVNKDTSKYKLKYESNIKHSNNWKGCELISGVYMCTLKHSAKIRNIKVDITAKDLWDKFVSQNGRCKITNIPLKMVSNSKTDNKNNQTGSVDRIDCSEGYTIQNTRWVHKIINRMRWTYSDEYFYSMCQQIVDYNNTKKRIKVSNVA